MKVTFICIIVVSPGRAFQHIQISSSAARRISNSYINCWLMKEWMNIMIIMEAGENKLRALDVKQVYFEISFTPNG